MVLWQGSPCKRMHVSVVTCWLQFPAPVCGYNECDVGRSWRKTAVSWRCQTVMVLLASFLHVSFYVFSSSSPSNIYWVCWTLHALLNWSPIENQEVILVSLFYSWGNCGFREVKWLVQGHRVRLAVWLLSHHLLHCSSQTDSRPWTHLF